MTNAALAFDALGDPTRRAIFERVASRPQSVGKLAERMSVSRPAVSQHLKVLKGAGLVSDRPEGTRRIYSVDLKGVMAMRGYLEKFWDGALAAFQAAADEPDEPDEAPEEAGEAGEAGEVGEAGEAAEAAEADAPGEAAEAKSTAEAKPAKPKTTT